MKMFKLFKKESKEIYQCLKVKEGILAIISKDLREKHKEKYNIDMFNKEPYLFCELKLNELPLKKSEKRTLDKIGMIYFYIDSRLMPTKFIDILNFFKKKEKEKIC